MSRNLLLSGTARRVLLVFLSAFIALTATTFSGVTDPRVNAQGAQRPFFAAMSASLVSPNTLVGNGIATQLGKFEFSGSRTISGAPTPSVPCVEVVSANVTLTTSTGDALNLEMTEGELCFDFSTIEEGFVTFDGYAKWISGSASAGRFVGAVAELEQTWRGVATPTGSTFDGVFAGTISY